ncbi:hypothetical protein [Streptomyces sp. NPDC051016]|uniref:hypothetical protein n=1 Tax=Streptomyces sp. NPDC051016 TaxID=3365638 RepID=UPI00378A01A6
MGGLAYEVTPLPHVTGQDAEFAAVRRMVYGDQCITVRKPFGPEAAVGGAVAVAADRGPWHRQEHLGEGRRVHTRTHLPPSPAGDCHQAGLT